MIVIYLFFSRFMNEPMVWFEKKNVKRCLVRKVMNLDAQMRPNWAQRRAQRKGPKKGDHIHWWTINEFIDGNPSIFIDGFPLIFIDGCPTMNINGFPVLWNPVLWKNDEKPLKNNEKPIKDTKRRPDRWQKGCQFFVWK